MRVTLEGMVVGAFVVLLAMGLSSLVFRQFNHGPYKVCLSMHLDTLQIVQQGKYIDPYVAYVCDKVAVQQ